LEGHNLMEQEFTDTEIIEWLEKEWCSVLCWNVPTEEDYNNGWTVSGADTPEQEEHEPEGRTFRDAVIWAMKLQREGKFKTRREEE
jgi:hypothetical protein